MKRSFSAFNIAIAICIFALALVALVATITAVETRKDLRQEQAE